ncbi:MAG: hypothetical protein KA712_19660 [Myxococcales bacterium]|nr:hypothetical protein [Myxococcales bacterium]
MAAKQHNPGFEALVESIKVGIRECSVEEVRRRQEARESFWLLDVREDHEFAVDRAAGAQHLGRGILERDIETVIPDKNAEIVLYCGGGYRSALAADNLQKMGYRRVVSMAGGMRAWRAAGLPVQAGEV